MYRDTLRPTTKSKTDFYTLFIILNMPQGRNQTDLRGQNSDVNRNFLSLQLSDASYKSWTTIVCNFFLFY